MKWHQFLVSRPRRSISRSRLHRARLCSNVPTCPFFPLSSHVSLRFPDFSPTFPISMSVSIFTITAEIHSRSLANFYCQYAERRDASVIVKNKLTSVFSCACPFSLRIHSAIASWIHSYLDNVMTKFMINNSTDA